MQKIFKAVGNFLSSPVCWLSGSFIQCVTMLIYGYTIIGMYWTALFLTAFFLARIACSIEKISRSAGD